MRESDHVRVGVQGIRAWFCGVIVYVGCCSVAASNEPSIEVRRCYVCVDKDRAERSVEVLEALPVYAERCAEVKVEAPAVCNDLLGPDGVARLRAAELEAMTEATLLSKARSGREGHKASSAKMQEAMLLGGAIHHLQQLDTGRQWAKVLSAMESAGLEMGGHGFGEDASRLLNLREEVSGSIAAASGTPSQLVDMNVEASSRGGENPEQGLFIVGPEGADSGPQTFGHSLPRLPPDPLYSDL